MALIKMHKLIEFCRNTSVPIKLALLMWSVYVFLSDTAIATGFGLNWKAVSSLIAITSATILATDLFRWIQARRPSRMFRDLHGSIRACLSAVESNVNLNLSEHVEQDIDSNLVDLIDRHKLFNKLASLGITLPDDSEPQIVVRFLLHIALCSQTGALSEARKFSKELKDGKVSFE